MINKSDMLQDIERVLVPEEEIHARIKDCLLYTSPSPRDS